MWDWAIWGALILSGLAGIGAVALLAVRALGGWRDFKRARRRLLGQLDELTQKAEATADKVADAGDTAELQESVERLRVSLAQLAVLREAIDEAKEPLDTVAAVLPLK